MRIALYVRVSTRDGKQEYENQLLQLRKFVGNSQDWQIVKEYADKITGSTSDRPAFKQMFVDASRKEFDMVLFWSLDRFSREGVLDTLQHLKRLTSQGIEWFSYKEEYLRSIGVFRDAILAILAVVAQQERIRLSERVTAGLERAKKNGKRIGRPNASVKTDKRKNPVNLATVLAMRVQGNTLKTIAEYFSASEATICRIMRRYNHAENQTNTTNGKVTS